jgi:arylsulfatase A-like enzyme
MIRAEMPDSSTHPNILFLQADQLRPDWIGRDSTVSVRTPNLDALEERGVRFSNAVCPSPVCNPSRASVASGYEYDRCGVRGNVADYPIGQTTYFERLRDEAGYHVMGCGKFDLATDFPLDITGDDGVERWGFSEALFNPAKWNTTERIRTDPNREPRDPYTEYLAERGLLGTHVKDYDRRRDEWLWTATFPTPLPDEAYYDNWITRNGLNLLDGAPDDRPWFLQVNFQNPHHPWDITERMHGLYRDPDVAFPPPIDSDLDVDHETHMDVRRNYAAMVEHLDECVGRFVDRLKERGQLEETLVVFSSDHGEQLGDHGQWQKLTPYQASVGVPLVVAGPDVAARELVDSPVTILDLHATFLECASLSPAEGIDSRSMRPLLAGESNQLRDVVYSGLGSWRLVYDGRYKLVEGFDPDLRTGPDYEPMQIGRQIARRRQRDRETLLLDIADDERENLADEHPDRVAALSERLREIHDPDG